MNIFSNIGLPEIIIILLLALLVIGPEKLPEFGRKLGKTLRDLRRVYENLSRELGPEINSLQQPIQELRQSIDSVRSIPSEMVQTVAKASGLDETVKELQGLGGSVAQVGQTLSSAGKMVTNPVATIVETAKSAMLPAASQGAEPAAEQPKEAAEPAPTQSAPEEQAHE